jgi:cytochrome c-type biogenesis protein CcmF
MEKRNALKVWTILLAILAFSLSLLGTFLVRSGVLTSVHAPFATDPTRGVFILLILCIFIGGSLTLLLARLRAEAGRPVRADLARGRAGAQQSVPDHRLRDRVHRHALSAGAGSADRRQDFGRRAVLQSDLRAAVLPLMIAVPFGPLLAWKRGDLLGAAQRLIAAGFAALIAIAVVWAWTRRQRPSRRSRSGLRCFVIARRADRATLPSAPACSGVPLGRSRCGARAACRARPGARCSPMPASASR